MYKIFILLCIVIFTGCTISNEDYIIKDVEKCKTAKIECKNNEEIFFDDVGCGCRRKLDIQLDVDTSICDSNKSKPVCAQKVFNCVDDTCKRSLKTYKNECIAKKFDANVIYEGECKQEF